MLNLSFPVGITLHGHFFGVHIVFEILAFYFGISYYNKLRRKNVDYFNEEQRITLILAAAMGAFLGSRLLAIVEHYDILFSKPTWLFITQTKTIVGGIIGGWIGIEIAKKITHITKSSGDLVTFPLILAIAVGRIGCALTGVSDSTAGIPSILPWAFDQGDGIARHPTAIYEILFLIALWFALQHINKRYTLRNGDLFKFFMIGYCAFRLAVEFIKPVLPIFLGLSAIQIASLSVLIYYAITLSNRLITKQNTN